MRHFNHHAPMSHLTTMRFAFEPIQLRGVWELFDAPETVRWGWVGGCMLRAASCELQAASCKLRAASCML